MKIGAFFPLATKHVETAPENSGHLDTLLEPRDRVIAKVIRLLHKGLSLRDNLNFEEKTVRLQHGVAQDIVANLRTGIDFIQHDNEHFGKLKVEIRDQKRARITFQWDTDPGEPTDVRLLIWGK